ncbi:MAG: hypothetical protein HOJ34_11030 [Kordiimonadaceae bacterium]|jgi:predicted metal-dependent enzyme (double-stranded beta helix superfamily)|nr:hypothetical protein [Kordiimonadaceae bacterium]MBT6036040.1 hypothetical protein [Kordiimonadaceae bacterium]MBT6330304.1 hypothetical protein [Kordiimonadaceae bacterium]MBT7581554.1 hypothetical protein [Kordiimonadaceae bacterium]
MSSVSEKREQELEVIMNKVRNLAGPVEVSRENLEQVKEVMIALAGKGEYWAEDQFAAPLDGKIQNRYLIAKDDDDSYALYLNVMHKGKYAPPHNHTTWACVTAAQGEEFNYVYTPDAEGPLEPGMRPIQLTDTIVVKPGQGICLLPDDIHAIAINEGESTRHLHLYGRALETLENRILWEKDLKTCNYYDMDIKTIK